MTTQSTPESGLPLISKRVGILAREHGYRLHLQVCRSNAGYYLGTVGDEGPVSRESVEYWRSELQAAMALNGKEGVDWTQRDHL